MKYRIYNLFAFAFLVKMIISLPLFAQNSAGKNFYQPANALAKFEITGKLQGLNEGDNIRLIAFTGQNAWETVDSTSVKDGKFILSGVLPGKGPRYCELEFIEHRKLYRFAISNGEKISLTSDDIGHVDSFGHTYLDVALNFTGGPSNRTHFRMLPAFKMYSQSIFRLNNYLQKIKDSIGFNGPLVEGIIEAKDKITHSFYQSFLSKVNDPEIENRLAVALIVYYSSVYEISNRSPFLMEFYSKLKDEEKDSDIIKRLKGYVELSIGQPFPLFTLPTADGKQIALKDILGKSKVTLVNFWGSADYGDMISDGYLKENQKELRAYFKKYHDKGFNIVGVAAEDSSTLYNYRKILREQQYPWPIVSDLKGNMKGSIIHDVYKEGGHRLPNVTNVLIDEKGKILAWDPTGIVLQYYLWKAFGE